MPATCGYRWVSLETTLDIPKYLMLSKNKVFLIDGNEGSKKELLIEQRGQL